MPFFTAHMHVGRLKYVLLSAVAVFNLPSCRSREHLMQVHFSWAVWQAPEVDDLCKVPSLRSVPCGLNLQSVLQSHQKSHKRQHEYNTDC